MFQLFRIVMLSVGLKNDVHLVAPDTVQVALGVPSARRPWKVWAEALPTQLKTKAAAKASCWIRDKSITPCAR